MKDTDLKKYLAGVLAIELHIYTLNGVIEELTRRHNSLGKHNKLNVPLKKKPSISFFDCFINSGLVSGFVVGLIALFIEVGKAQNILDAVAAIIAALINAVGGLVIGGIIFGPIAYVIRRHKEEQRLEAEFQSRIQKYDAEVKKENTRLANERAKRTALAREINTLKTRLSQAKNTLLDAYSYNILSPEYQNIYAVSSIHGYLAKGRTHCLQFNEQTGDQGAYNLYESERRLDRIITNTEEILERLDYVMQYQQDLAIGLNDASKRIESLCSNVNTQLKKISGSVANIAQNQSVIAYNTECAARELEFMNWMNILF